MKFCTHVATCKRHSNNIYCTTEQKKTWKLQWCLTLMWIPIVLTISKDSFVWFLGISLIGVEASVSVPLLVKILKARRAENILGPHFNLRPEWQVKFAAPNPHLNKEVWICHHWDVHTHYCHFLTLTCYFLCTS